VISRSSLTDAYPKKQLGDVVEFLDSMRRPVTESDRRAGEYPYYGANGLQGTIDDYIFDEPLVLLAEDGGHFGSPERGIAYRVSGKTWVNNHAHVLRPKECVDLGFLCRVLENYDVTPWVTGTTRGKLTQAGAAQIVVPLPSLPEQRRIAEILDKADALRARRRAALAQLDTLTQSIFLDMFGDPATNPKGIRKQPLGELIKLKSGDFLPAAEMAESGTYPVLGGNGISGFHDQYKFEEPQIVIGRVGAYCGCVHVSPAKSWITDNALYVSERHPDLLFDYLVQALTLAHLNQYASQFGQPLVSGSRIYPVHVLVPPREAQHEFVARATRLQELKRTQEMSHNQFDVLFASLQHRAFQGEL
jgi:type I restriction enzyme S subunit